MNSLSYAEGRWFSSSNQAWLNAVVAQLYVAHRQTVQLSLLRLGVTAADVDDVCTEVFVVALRRLPTYRGDSGISTWLLGIARKLASDYRRSARARVEVLVAQAPEQKEDLGPEHLLNSEQRARAVRVAISDLKRGPRTVVKRFAIDEASMGRVASEQRVPLQTAYARLYSAHSALRESLAPLMAE